MKNLFTLLFITLLVVSCSQEKKSYTINGTVPDESYNNKWVYMSVDDENQTVIDSALIENNKFSFHGSKDTADIVRLYLGNRLYANVILENGNISVDMSNPLSIKGTPLNDLLVKYDKSGSDIYDQAQEELKSIEEKYQNDDKTRVQLSNERGEYYLYKLDSLNNSYFYANKDNALGKYIFASWFHFLSPEKAESVYADAGDIVKRSPTIQLIMKANEKKNSTSVGKMFTDFTIENGNKDNTPVSFSDYVGKGKYVLVDFWASWCGPCLAETPVLTEVYKKYKGDKFEILGVAVWDKRDATLKAIEQHNIKWPQILDAQTIPTDIYGINGIPHIMLIGPDGTILERELRGDKLKAKIDEVMKLD